MSAAGRVPVGRQLALAGLLAAGALALPGCSWLGGKDEKPPAPLPDIKATAAGRVAWQQPLNAAGQPGFTPAVTPGAVYAATPDGSLARPVRHRC